MCAGTTGVSAQGQVDLDNNVQDDSHGFGYWSGQDPNCASWDSILSYLAEESYKSVHPSNHQTQPYDPVWVHGMNLEKALHDNYKAGYAGQWGQWLVPCADKAAPFVGSKPTQIICSPNFVNGWKQNGDAIYNSQTGPDRMFVCVLQDDECSKKPQIGFPFDGMDFKDVQPVSEMQWQIEDWQFQNDLQKSAWDGFQDVYFDENATIDIVLPENAVYTNPDGPNVSPIDTTNMPDDASPVTSLANLKAVFKALIHGIPNPEDDVANEAGLHGSSSGAELLGTTKVESHSFWFEAQTLMGWLGYTSTGPGTSFASGYYDGQKFSWKILPGSPADKFNKLCGDRLVIFSGSDDSSDWVDADFNFAPEYQAMGTSWHIGIYKEASQWFKPISLFATPNGDYQTIFAGHSLGGGMSQVAAVYYKYQMKAKNAVKYFGVGSATAVHRSHTTPSSVWYSIPAHRWVNTGCRKHYKKNMWGQMYDVQDEYYWDVVPMLRDLDVTFLGNTGAFMQVLHFFDPNIVVGDVHVHLQQNPYYPDNILHRDWCTNMDWGEWKVSPVSQKAFSKNTNDIIHMVLSNSFTGEELVHMHSNVNYFNWITDASYQITKAPKEVPYWMSCNDNLSC